MRSVESLTMPLHAHLKSWGVLPCTLQQTAETSQITDMEGWASLQTIATPNGNNCGNRMSNPLFVCQPYLGSSSHIHPCQLNYWGLCGNQIGLVAGACQCG